MTDETRDVQPEASGGLIPPAGTSPPLLIPEDVSYNCQGCGRCCAGWAVGLTETDWAKVKDTDWSSLHPDLSDRELFVHRQDEFASGVSRYPHYTKAREDGSCPFLIDNLCFIHGHLGEENKPGMCKLFPYTFVPTPSGVYVGLLYNSNAAVRNIGRPLTEQRDMLAEMWRTHIAQEMAMHGAGQSSGGADDEKSSGGAVEASPPEFRVSLSNGLPITWQEYLVVEERLIALLTSAAQPSICHRLMAGGEVIVEAMRLKREGADFAGLAEFEPKVDAWMAMTPGMFENLLFSGICFRNFVWPSLRREHKELWVGTERSPLSDRRIVAAAVKTVFGKEMSLPAIGQVNLGKTFKMPVAALSPEIERFFTRYFYMRLFSKTYFGMMLAGLSVLAGYNNMVANFLAALVFAKAYAAARGDGAIAIADLYEAYFQQDKELIALSQLPADRAAFYDLGFSSPRLFHRLTGTMARTIG